jgi:hypothetical protein
VSRKGFIVGPFYDSVFFIFSPLLALLLGYGVGYTPAFRQPVLMAGGYERLSDIAISVIIYAHLFLVFFRSHGNQAIFRAHRFRFTVVPAALFLACWASPHVLVLTTLVATWWDVYHSSLQTFGLGRIYDARAGNDAQAGRRLDYLFNLLLYLGPVLGGAVLLDHLKDFQQFAAPEIGWMYFASVPAWVAPRSAALTRMVLLIAIPFLLYYIWAYWRLWRGGYKVSPQKVTLYAITALVSVVAWGFNSFGQAFLIMNFFHAWQYFAIVWWSENKNIAGVLGVSRLHFSREVTFAVVFGTAAAYGYWASSFQGGKPALLALTVVVSIMHFWYDGFIWSVRKRQIPDQATASGDDPPQMLSC